MAVIAGWFITEKKLDVYPIYQKKTELFFWAAVLLSNSLGTAFGDYLSDSVGLSYGYAAVLCADIIGLVLVLHYWTKINQVFLFWVAFIFTRPFGATFGDLLTKPVVKGGLDLGTIQASTVTFILLAGVLIVAYRHKDQIQQ